MKTFLIMKKLIFFFFYNISFVQYHLDFYIFSKNQIPYLEKDLYDLFETHNKFDKYILSSPVRPHYGLLDNYEPFDRSSLRKIGEAQLAKANASQEDKSKEYRYLSKINDSILFYILKIKKLYKLINIENN